MNVHDLSRIEDLSEESILKTLQTRAEDGKYCVSFKVYIVMFSFYWFNIEQP